MDGIRILEVAEHTFVPLASAVLADWGADVIKIEHVERGDAMRGLGESGGIQVGGGGVHVLMENSNRGKRSLAVDLSTPEGREIVYRLAETSDVFLTNKLPAVRSKLHVDVDDIRARNPNIIYAAGTGYGTRGEDVDLGGYDFLGYWARSGHAVSAKPPEIDYMPRQAVPALGDSIGAMFIAGGIASALFHRERTGEPLVVDVSLLATGMWSMGAAIAVSQMTKRPYALASNAEAVPQNPLYGSYRTADDSWIALCMLQGFHYWPEACRILRHPEWVDDPRFATWELLYANGKAAANLISGEVATETLAFWKDRLRGLRGQWTIMHDSLNIADDPMVQANDYLLETSTADGIPFKLVATPVQFNGEANQPRRSPTFNEHGDQILLEDLGFTEEQLIDLKVAGVVA